MGTFPGQTHTVITHRMSCDAGAVDRKDCERLMSDLNELARRISPWLKGTGPESDIVISSRVRLARNLTHYPFTSRATEHEKREITILVRERLRQSELTRDFEFLSIEDQGPLDRQFLVERQLISRELAGGDGPRAVAFAEDESVSIMINEEDHIRLQVMESGLALAPAWERADKLDDALDEALQFAFHPQFGYLTACPTNVGTGLRASVMLHLPALTITREIERVLRTMQKLHLAVRGLFGEGTQPSGDFYQISNQITLGRSEEDVLEELQQMLPTVIEYERKARQALLENNRDELQDGICRSLGILKSAHTITSEETMFHLSRIRLGVNLGFLDIPISIINELFMQTQPAHLQKLHGQELGVQERNVMRASLLREKLADVN